MYLWLWGLGSAKTCIYCELHSSGGLICLELGAWLTSSLFQRNGVKRFASVAFQMTSIKGSPTSWRQTNHELLNLPAGKRSAPCHWKRLKTWCLSMGRSCSICCRTDAVMMDTWMDCTCFLSYLKRHSFVVNPQPSMWQWHFCAFL